MTSGLSGARESMKLQTVSVEEVVSVYNSLIADFAASNDPISPVGIRSEALLDSAVSRQHTSLGSVLKYPEPISNAATLLYGICNDHPFINGNKRAALVATLVHLDKNKLTLYETTQSDLYDLMLRVADHTIGTRIPPRSKNFPRRSADEEVSAISKWLQERAHRVRRGERQITFRELRRILEGHGFRLENPHSNMIEIVRYVDEQKGWLTRKRVTVRRRLGMIGWTGDNRDMAIGDIKNVREMCSLREEDWCDSEAFYDQSARIDAFVNRYRAVLRRLARV